MIALEKICIRAGQFQLSDISFEVPQGAYAVLMGKTGAGKTTLLETIIGLRVPQAGRVLLHGQDVTKLRPSLRGIGYVPQDGALFSTMTVAEQMSLALIIRRVSKQEIRQRVAALADLLGIEHLLQRKPRGLSGGERQRVALGRALSFQPPVLCLDEPLSALDEETRLNMCSLLNRIREQTGVTTLHVTHNPAEASSLADLLVRIVDGKVVRSE